MSNQIELFDKSFNENAWHFCKYFELCCKVPITTLKRRFVVPNCSTFSVKNKKLSCIYFLMININ